MIGRKTQLHLKSALRRSLATHSRTVGQKSRIVIVGSGWAGFSLLKKLDVKLYDITVIAPRSYFVFTPLLAGTATGTLEFRCALESVRATKKCNFHEAWVDTIDFQKQTLQCSSALHSRKAKDKLPFTIEYDKLILTPGCYSNTFNIPGVSEYAHFLKDVKDARAIRSRILKCFEEAELPTTPVEEKKRLLSFCIVGGGPTGIEFAGELHDLCNYDLRKLYPELYKYVAIDIYDVAEQILGNFDQKLGDYARNKFARDGINVHTRQAPIRVESDRLVFKEPHAAKGYGLLVWSTGLMASPLVRSLTECRKDSKTGSIVTNDFLQIVRPDGTPMDNVYALGDCATTAQTLPATAQVATQKGQYLARALNKSAMGIAPQDFEFHNRGVMAFLGGGSAIVQMSGNMNISGFMAYLTWKFAYLTMTVSMRNKILIPIYWALNGLLGRDINRF